MTHTELLEMFKQSEVIILAEEYYNDAIVGLTTTGRAIYSYNKLVEITMNVDGLSEEDAMDYVNYNVCRGCEYEQGGPIIMDCSIYED